MSAHISARMAELAERHVPFVHATVVRAERPTSAHAGDDAIVLADGTIEGFVGGQCAEHSLRTAALDTLREGHSLLLRVLPDGTDTFPETDGARVAVNRCLSGGALEIFLQPQLPAPVVRVVGGTPTADAVAALAAALDLAVLRDDVAEPGDVPQTAVVVASHGHGEEAAIRAALDAGVGYVGLVASRRRGDAVLAAMGLDEAERARVHTPAGLPLGAATAPEVALAILAEIVRAIRLEGLTAPETVHELHDHHLPSEAPGDHAVRERSDQPERGDHAPPGPGGPGGAPIREREGGVHELHDHGQEVAVDPVCGMTVVPGPDVPHLEVHGVTYWFCAPGCRAAYAARTVDAEA
jgi:xanthine dehydrogenase accessory factor